MATLHPTTHSFPARRVAAALLVAVFACGTAHAGSRAFDAAVQQYRAGHLSDAFGRFFALANEGDADAARIALFMHQYGPTLYGRYWDASPSEVARWQALQDRRGAHPAPPFRPDWPDAGAALPKQPNVARGFRKVAEEAGVRPPAPARTNR